ncbi:hypothetical protein [Bifidobacterium canis]|uniref:DUF4192 family protein n=1 Tax=Bifidobacterium canis TaxID=2610880 RepID=A0A7K1J2X2_9BIFI|nr:hypothetical protein [Bifidobacterium canis]MUH58891.1 hypothetical protein [Bifidobacterium canis]
MSNAENRDMPNETMIIEHDEPERRAGSPAKRFEELRGEFVRMYVHKGIHATAAHWVGEIAEAWFPWLDDVSRDVDEYDEEALLTMAVGITESLAIRDALLISVVIDKERWNMQMIRDFATDPHEVRNATAMSSMLTDAFADKQHGPDRARCMHAVDVMRRITRELQPMQTLQVRSVIAYLLWWLGDDEALGYGLDVLSDDNGITLASIVVTAVSRHVYPAFVEQQRRTSDSLVEIRDTVEDRSAPA